MVVAVAEVSTPWVGVAGTLAEVLAELKLRQVDPDQSVSFYYDGATSKTTAIYYRGLDLDP